MLKIKMPWWHHALTWRTRKSRMARRLETLTTKINRWRTESKPSLPRYEIVSDTRTVARKWAELLSMIPMLS